MNTINLRNDVRGHLSNYFDKYLTSEMVVYDIGCGPNPFSQSLKAKVRKHVGVDIDNGFYEKGYIDLVGSAYDVPVEDAGADAVISSQVLEHLEDPRKAIEETARILKRGGYFLCSFPFLYPIHAAPHDYSRISEFYMKKMLMDSGLEVIEQNRIGGFWYIIGMYTGMYLQAFDRGLFKKMKIVSVLSCVVRWLLFQIQKLENTILNFCGKDAENFSSQWTVNYVIVAQKI